MRVFVVARIGVFCRDLHTFALEPKFSLKYGFHSKNDSKRIDASLINTKHLVIIHDYP